MHKMKQSLLKPNSPMLAKLDGLKNLLTLLESKKDKLFKNRKKMGSEEKLMQEMEKEISTLIEGYVNDVQNLFNAYSNIASYR